MTDFLLVRDRATRAVVHQEAHDNEHLGSRKAADVLSRRWRELRAQYDERYEVLSGFGPTLEEFLRFNDSCTECPHAEDD